MQYHTISSVLYKARQASKSDVPATSAPSSNPELAKRQRRATVTFFLMFIALFIVITPPGIVSLVVTAASIAAEADTTLWFYIVDILVLNMFTLVYIADPSFILRYKDVKEAMAKLKWMPKLFY